MVYINACMHNTSTLNCSKYTSESQSFRVSVRAYFTGFILINRLKRLLTRGTIIYIIIQQKGGPL